MMTCKNKNASRTCLMFMKCIKKLLMLLHLPIACRDLISVTSRTRRRCWGVQHIGNIVANLYQGRDKNGFGSSIYPPVMMMKIMTRIIRWVMDKSQEDHVSNICILMINTMAILMSCRFILCFHVLSSEDAYSRCLRVATCVPWTSVHRWNGMMEGQIRCLQNSSNNNGTGYILSQWLQTHATSENQEVWPHLVWCEEWNHTQKSLYGLFKIQWRII